MPETAKYFCIERTLPPEFAWQADQQARQINPANQTFEAVLVGRRWLPGQSLYIAFLEGDPQLQQKVAFYARQWMQYANIIFLFDNHANAEIRIAFQSGIGTWSYVGTEALSPYIKPDEPTMNYDDLTVDSSGKAFSYYVLHEFGHVLGLGHEHSHPGVDIQWNKKALKEAYPKLSDEDLERNFFQRFTYSEIEDWSDEFDPTSIMCYSIRREWTWNDIEIPPNTRLSEMDKQHIQMWYPW